MSYVSVETSAIPELFIDRVKSALLENRLWFGSSNRENQLVFRECLAAHNAEVADRTKNQRSGKGMVGDDLFLGSWALMFRRK
ncbi:hypothetical protein NBM05_03985 [Rothia sp. AR01]|uniref:Uncharacterized protein n=1 Tax=Rothia santali TaxID=2949643 RepID=A0A9X2HE98_9MICC|nr:hypothetical protein [Rothia santali]MCP3425207.1 hypothetical protein [Rothia santali]